jgi:hypothetical protein
VALETASYVADLVSTNPDGGDQRSTADDHLRLVKAVLKRTWPKVDAAVSLSAVQYMYLNDLSASVQLQLNQLRDGSATANNAVNSRFANSASVANNIGSIPAAQVVALNATNVFEIQEPIRIRHDSGLLSFYNSAGTRLGYLQMVNGSFAALNIEANIPFLLNTNNTTRMTVAADGTVTFHGAVNGTISNATLAATATTATTAATATNATNAAFATSAGSSALLSGLAPSDTVSGNTIVQRNSSGQIRADYYYQSSAVGESISVGHIACMQNGDGFWRIVSIAQAGEYMQARNITGRSGTAKTLSSSSPSGGSNGDIWYQHA